MAKTFLDFENPIAGSGKIEELRYVQTESAGYFEIDSETNS
jgi:hypothetical protein